MGLTIDRERFDPLDYRRFERRLDECLVALGIVRRAAAWHGGRW